MALTQNKVDAMNRLPSGVYNVFVMKAFPKTEAMSGDNGIWKDSVRIAVKPVEYVEESWDREDDPVLTDNNEESYDAWRELNGNSNVLVDVDVRLSNNVDYPIEDMQVWSIENETARDGIITRMNRETANALSAFKASGDETLEDAIYSFIEDNEDVEDRMISLTVQNRPSPNGKVYPNYSFSRVRT